METDRDISPGDEADRELLELSAKAADISLFTNDDCGLYIAPPMRRWNPLTDDGDAFRLLMELCINIRYGSGYVYASHSSFRTCFAEHLDKGKESSIRRAIVRVAAEIGRKKQNEASNGN